MPVRSDVILHLTALLGTTEAQAVKRLALNADALELSNKRRLDRVFKEIVNKAIKALEDTGTLPEQWVHDMFLDLFATNAKVTQQAALASTGPSKLAKVPKNLPVLREWWDYYRKRKKIPAREKAHADKIAKEYLKKVQSVWHRSSYEFRTGGEQKRAEIVKAMKQAGRTAHARATTIVNTETTYYYNATRKKVYDSSPDVTHYLFIPVRDYATTKWCKTRDGLVLEKGTNFLDDNTPPCHWNCRSEITPLSPLNSRHKKLIDDPRRKPSNRRLEPLPPSWRRR